MKNHPLNRLYAPHLAPGRASRVQRLDRRLAAQVLGLHHQDPGDFRFPFPDGGHQRRVAGHSDILQHDCRNVFNRSEYVYVSRPFPTAHMEDAAML